MDEFRFKTGLTPTSLGALMDPDFLRGAVGEGRFTTGSASLVERVFGVARSLRARWRTPPAAALPGAPVVFRSRAARS